jgi:plastocyanin
MSRRTIPVSALSILFTVALAACGGGSAASPSVPAATSAAPAASSAAPAAGACAESTAAGTVAVSIKDFAFAPATITAKVGDVITFKNEDATAHTATVIDGGACTTPNIESGNADGLTFTAAGTYKFHCRIHQTMTGTITVS